MSTSIFWGIEVQVLLLLMTRLDVVVDSVWSNCRWDRRREYGRYIEIGWRAVKEVCMKQEYTEEVEKDNKESIWEWEDHEARKQSEYQYHICANYSLGCWAYGSFSLKWTKYREAFV